jgi:hypothetical protein
VACPQLPVLRYAKTLGRSEDAAVRFLCICQYAHSRSVACCRVLQARGHEAAALGAGTAASAIPHLSMWADKIILMDPAFGAKVPLPDRHKIDVFDVGPDRWSNPYNEELQEIIRGMADVRGY